MKTKHALLRGAVLAAMLSTWAPFAQAQATVTLYGLLDTGIEYLTNTNAAGDKLVRMPGLTGQFPSRWGFRGAEDLGGGMKAVFTLEGGFTTDAGSMGQANRLFGRQSWVGLQTSLGTVSFGRQYSMVYLSMFSSDLIGPNTYSMGSLNSYIPNARSDNTISYMGVFKGLTVGATYSLGRDTANTGPAASNCPGENASDHNICKQWTAMLKYDTAAWGAALAYDVMHGGPGASGGLVRSALTDTHLHASGWAKFAAVKIGGGVVRRENDGTPLTPKSDLLYLGANYLLTTPLVVDAQLLKLDYKRSVDDTRLAVLRGTYSLSRNTAVYLMGGRVWNSGVAALSVSAGGTIAPGMAQTGVMTGLRHSF